MQVIGRQAAVPGTAPIREDGALHLLHDGEAVLDRAEELAVAAELVLTVAAQRALAADTVLVELRDVARANAVAAAQREDLRAAGADVVLAVERVLLEVEVAAKAGELAREAHAAAAHRVVDIVARIRDVLERDAARRAEVVVEPLRIMAAVAHIAVIDMAHIRVLAVAQRHVVRRVLRDRAAKRQLTAGVLAHVRLLEIAVRVVIIILVRAVVDAERADRLLAVEPRAAVGEGVAVRILVVAALLVRQADRVARAAEVRVADRDHAEDAVLARVAGADAE